MTRIIELGKGMVKIEPCFVSDSDQRQAILLEPQAEPHEIGILTGDPAGPHLPADGSVLIILGSVESAVVLRDQLNRCIEGMGEGTP